MGLDSPPGHLAPNRRRWADWIGIRRQPLQARAPIGRVALPLRASSRHLPPLSPPPDHRRSRRAAWHGPLWAYSRGRTPAAGARAERRRWRGPYPRSPHASAAALALVAGSVVSVFPTR